MAEENKTAEISPPKDEIKFEQKAVPPKSGENMVENDSDKTMKDILQAIQKMATQQVSIVERLATLEKEYPPKDAKPVEGGVNHNATKEEQENFKHPDSYVKPVKDTTDGVQMLKAEDIEKMLEKVVEAKMNVVKASTPRPYGGRVDDELYVIAKADPVKAIRLAIEAHRKSAGGHYQSEDSFGFKSGAGNESAWREQSKFFTKMF